MILSADRIFDGKQWLREGTQLEWDDQGTLLRVGENLGVSDRHWKGVLCPGWVNAHTHVELSFMRGLISEGLGLVGFLEALMDIRKSPETGRGNQEAIQEAIEEMAAQGVVALGDIVNGITTASSGLEKEFHLHRFIELIGLTADPMMIGTRGIECLEAFRSQSQGPYEVRHSLVPHAPYSVSRGLFEWVNQWDPQALISIHNQESDQEDALYLDGGGLFRGFLERMVSKAFPFQPTGSRAWEGYSSWIAPTHPLLLVHNTYMSSEDIDRAMARYPELYWCLCPRANLYIEGRLPNLNLLLEKGARLCLGTDSLASNTSLSMVEEMRTLMTHFPSLEWSQLLHWGTLGGARALQMDGFLGQFKVGYSPGLVWIPHLEQGPSHLILTSPPHS